MGRVKQILSTIREDYFRFPMFILTHPIKGFDQMKYEKRGKVSVAVVLMFILAMVNIIKFAYSGFIVNFNNPYYMNSIFVLATTIAPIILFSVANWSVTVLMNGIGKFKEIFMVNMYAYYPAIYLYLLYTLLTNILTDKEIVLATFISVFAIVLYCFYVFFGLIVVHEFTFFKTIGSLLLTFLSMAIIVFVLMLLGSLVGEVVTFFMTVFSEIRLKFV